MTAESATVLSHQQEALQNALDRYCPWPNIETFSGANNQEIIDFLEALGSPESIKNLGIPKLEILFKTIRSKERLELLTPDAWQQLTIPQIDSIGGFNNPGLIEAASYMLEKSPEQILRTASDYTVARVEALVSQRQVAA